MISHNQLAGFIAAAYNRKPEKYLFDTWEVLEKSWEIPGLRKALSSSFEDFNYGYYGVSFINKEEKVLIVTHGGLGPFYSLDTLDFFWDTTSVLQVYFGYVPTQYGNACKFFIDHIIENKPELKDYKIINAGHSFGTVLANLANVELTALGYDVESINIEGLGSAPILEQYIHERGFDISLNDLCITTFNAPKHYANSFHQEVGDMFIFDMNYDYSGEFFGGIRETINNHFLGNIIKHAFNTETGEFNSLEYVQTHPYDDSCLYGRNVLISLEDHI